MLEADCTTCTSIDDPDSNHSFAYTGKKCLDKVKKPPRLTEFDYLALRHITKTLDRLALWHTSETLKNKWGIQHDPNEILTLASDAGVWRNLVRR